MSLKSFRKTFRFPGKSNTWYGGNWTVWGLQVTMVEMCRVRFEARGKVKGAKALRTGDIPTDVGKKKSGRSILDRSLPELTINMPALVHRIVRGRRDVSLKGLPSASEYPSVWHAIARGIGSLLPSAFALAVALTATIFSGNRIAADSHMLAVMAVPNLRALVVSLPQLSSRSRSSSEMISRISSRIFQAVDLVGALAQSS